MVDGGCSARDAARMVSVIDMLDVWGPDASVGSSVSLRQAQDYTRELTRTHYENFPVASWMLPRALRQHFCNVYAYCRWADDLGDEAGDPRHALVLLDWWRYELLECYEDRVRHPVFVALQETIREFHIPAAPFLDLISAFEQDQTQTEYETFVELTDYCRRSANPVGRLVLSLCREQREENLNRSDSICSGLQLANFWQDVARDADIGRTYLPREDRVLFDYSDDDLAGRVTNGSFIRLMTFEVERAREFLEAGRPLVNDLRGRLQVDIDLFVRGGLQILDEIERIGYRVWEQRPVIGKGRFATLFVKSVCAAAGRNLRPSLIRSRHSI